MKGLMVISIEGYKPFNEDFVCKEVYAKEFEDKEWFKLMFNEVSNAFQRFQLITRFEFKAESLTRGVPVPFKGEIPEEIVEEVMHKRTERKRRSE